MKCPHCESDNIEVLITFPTLDYAGYGEYCVLCQCKNCSFKFYNTEYADSPMFGEEV